MAKINPRQGAQVETGPGFEGHYENLDDYTVGYERWEAGADLSPMFSGLPDNRCQSRHWGVVLRGQLIYRYTDGSEDVINEGEAYYARPGHVPVLTEGTELIEFSPSGELQETLRVVKSNIAASGG